MDRLIAVKWPFRYISLTSRYIKVMTTAMSAYVMTVVLFIMFDSYSLDRVVSRAIHDTFTVIVE